MRSPFGSPCRSLWRGLFVVPVSCLEDLSMKSVMRFVRLDVAAGQFGASKREFLADFRTMSDRERQRLAREVIRSVRKQKGA